LPSGDHWPAAWIFPELRKLFLNGAKGAEGFAALLARTSGLTLLDVSWAHLGNLEPVAGLPSLEFLDCFFTQVTDLEPLAGLGSLVELSCFGTGVASLEPLTGLRSP
jgi:Leucine-rich repeat (LRR) protein